PKMSRVEKAAPLARVREPLAGAGAGPDVGIVGHSCEPECVGPSADAREEVPLSRPSDICGGEIDDGATVDLSLWDLVMGDEGLQPCPSKGVVVVVEGGHRASRRVANISGHPARMLTAGTYVRMSGATDIGAGSCRAGRMCDRRTSASDSSRCIQSRWGGSDCPGGHSSRKLPLCLVSGSVELCCADRVTASVRMGGPYRLAVPPEHDSKAHLAVLSSGVSVDSVNDVRGWRCMPEDVAPPSRLRGHWKRSEAREGLGDHASTPPALDATQGLDRQADGAEVRSWPIPAIASENPLRAGVHEPDADAGVLTGRCRVRQAVLAGRQVAGDDHIARAHEIELAPEVENRLEHRDREPRAFAQCPCRARHALRPLQGGRGTTHALTLTFISTSP